MYNILKYLLFLINILANANCDLVYYLVGGVTDTTVNIKAKTTTAESINLYLNGVLKGTFDNDKEFYYDMTLTNLTADTDYTLGLNLGKNNVEGTYTVSFPIKTFPSVSQRKDFSFIVSSYAYSGSEEVIYERLRAVNPKPKFLMLLGNIYSKNINSEDWKDYEAEYLNAFTREVTKNLYTAQPLIYIFGENEVKGSLPPPQIAAVNKAYRQIFPSYTLPSNGVYQSFRHGDTLFLLTDVNTFITPTTLFGTVQYNWLLSEINKAASDSQVKAIFIAISQPWNYVASAYDWDTIKQNYDSLLESVSQEKKDVGEAFRKNVNFNRPDSPNFKSVMMLIGQPHIAFDEGTWNNYGNFPIAVCGPLDYWQQCRGGPYSHGSFHDSYSQYCDIKVYSSPSGNTCIQIKGVIPRTTKKSSTEQILFIYDTCQPIVFRGKINIKCPIDYKEKILNAGITLAAIILVYVFFFVILHKLSLKALSYSTIKED